MKKNIAIRRCAAAAALAVGAALAAGSSALAADNADSDHTGSATIACDGVRQDRAACLREAGAARQERKTDGLTDAGTRQQQEGSALARCDAQPAAARAECEARIRGTGSTSSQGSVLGGGIVRETITPTPAPAAR